MVGTGFLVESGMELTARQYAYQKFLESPLWDQLRHECYRLANWTCARCGGKRRQFHAHHTRYPDRWEDTTQADLECLCFKCHGIDHGILPLPIKPAEPAEEIKTLLDAKLARKKGLITREQFLVHRRAFRERGIVLRHEW